MGVETLPGLLPDSADYLEILAEELEQAIYVSYLNEQPHVMLLPESCRRVAEKLKIISEQIRDEQAYCGDAAPAWKGFAGRAWS